MKSLLTMVLALASAAALQAQSSFTVTLTGAAERPTPVVTSATGNGTLTLNVGNTLTYNVTFSGLSGTGFTASHIHSPADVNGFAGVLITLSGGVGGSFSGTLSGTTRVLTAPEISDLQNQLMYVNVHSQAFTGGEIRGQIVPVPEPGTLALAGLGTLGLLAALRRKA